MRINLMVHMFVCVAEIHIIAFNTCSTSREREKNEAGKKSSIHPSAQVCAKKKE